MRPEWRRNEAAVDSELAWLPLVKMNVPLSGPLPNWVYGATNPALLHPTNGILLVARLDGPSVEIARGLVDKALAAERDGLWGRAYFDARGLPKPTPIKNYIWATNGSWARRKSAANWVLKQPWTKIPPPSPPIFQ